MGHEWWQHGGRGNLRVITAHHVGLVQGRPEREHDSGNSWRSGAEEYNSGWILRADTLAAAAAIKGQSLGSIGAIRKNQHKSEVKESQRDEHR